MIGPTQGDAYLKMKLKDQNKAMQILQESPSLQGLNQIQAPYVDLEVRGVPALQYFGNLVWQDAFKEQTGRAQSLWWPTNSGLILKNQVCVPEDLWQRLDNDTENPSQHYSSWHPPPHQQCLAISSHSTCMFT